MPVAARARVVALTALLVAVGCVLSEALVRCAPAGALNIESDTTSYFEPNASANELYLQGERAGSAGEQGIVILDFGRPAAVGASDGTLTFGGGFATLAAVEAAVQRYISAYFAFAPRWTRLDVAVGTNDNRGAGQPCGSGVCGCTFEPTSYARWGADLAHSVERLEAWARQDKYFEHASDTVNVIAADDAEPAYDPGYANTYALLSGYATAVGGPSPAMVDYGSAEAGYWSEHELWQVAFGLAPDVPMPEIYRAAQAQDWASLVSYAKHTGHDLSIFGVLTESAGSNSAGTAYHEMREAVAAISGQVGIPWLSSIRR